MAITYEWINTANLAGATHVRSLYCMGGVLYAGTQPNGDVFKYNAGTDTWTNTGNLNNATHVYALHSIGGVLYAGTYPNGNVFKYNSGADTWANTGNLAGATHVKALYCMGGILYAGTLPNGDVFKYDVGTDTWTNTGNLNNATTVLSIYDISGVLYAGTYPNGNVFKYNSGADTWANTGDLDGASYVYALHSIGGVLYAGTRPNGNVFKYNSGADTWTNTGNLNNATHVYALHSIGGVLYAGTYPNGNVFTYNGGTDTWINTDDLTDATYVYTLHSIGEVLYGGTQPNGDVFVLETTISKTSSMGLDIQETKTKTSTIGSRIVVKKAKTSITGLSVSIKEVPQISSIGLGILGTTVKESSIGIYVSGENSKESSIGLSVPDAFTKESSIALSVQESPTNESTVGLTAVERETHTSLIGATVLWKREKESSVGMRIVTVPVKESSITMYISGSNLKHSSIGVTPIDRILEQGLFYAKLGNTILTGITPENFRIAKEIDKIPTFEFEIANCDENRTTIANGIYNTFRIYWQHHGEDTHIFTGIINADGIEYISLDSILITGYASYVTLAWPFHKHLADEDKENTDVVLNYNGGFTNYTTQANNDNVNDVLVSFNGVNDTLYIGNTQQFWGLQIKYSTKGVCPEGCVVKLEYSKGNGIWGTLDALDESNAFTEAPGTYDLVIPHPPEDWARSTDGNLKKYWIRFRIDSGSYSVAPKLDRIHTVDIDIYRSYYFDTSAREILLNVLDGTDYTMDAIDQCPTDIISIVAEYESPLRIIAGIAKALTWTNDEAEKKSYQWWIDDAKKVHIKTQRGTTYDEDITGDMTIFNNQEDYFHLSNRLHGLGPRDGLSQIRSIVEDKASIGTHGLREIAVSKENVGKYLMLRNALEKDIAISKEPMQRIKGSVSTQFWELQGYDIGDTITLHQAAWNVAETQMQIVKVEMGPQRTTLNLGISQEHLDGLKNDMQRQLNLNNIQMHGSTTMIQAGPERMNYQRKSDSEVFSAKLEIEIPNDVKKIHKVVASWTLGPYRASVAELTKTGGGHAHGGAAGTGGAQEATSAGKGGGFTPDVAKDGKVTPKMLSKAHIHNVSQDIQLEYETYDIGVMADPELYPQAGKVENTKHRHRKGPTSAEWNDGVYALVPEDLRWNELCEACNYYLIEEIFSEEFTPSGHYHVNTGLYTTYTEPSMYVNAYRFTALYTIGSYEFSQDSVVEDPAHEHEGVEQAAHDHEGVYDGEHEDHAIAAVTGHNDHVITAMAAFALMLNYAIQEIPGGTTMELLVNSEKIGEYTSAQTEIRIDGYMHSGNNTIELQPVAGENKKGSATIRGNGLLFVEPVKF